MTASGAERADRLDTLLRERELDALLLTNPLSVRYLAGFTGTNGVCVLGSGVRVFLTDFRYVEQAQRQVHGFELARGRQDLLGDATDRLVDARARRVGFEDHDLTVRRHTRLRELVPDEIELVPAGAIVEELRAVKDAGELTAIRAAAELADSVYADLALSGFAGRSEREVMLDLESRMRQEGAEPSFATIVAGGPNGALPHATPSDDPIPPDALVVVDMGCLLDGYCSDCTRTLASGEGLSDEARAIYETVLAAQELALGGVRDGAVCRDVDALARDAIAEAGHGDRFGHGLGHGVGLEVHEGPRLTQAAAESERLTTGNVVTVEPGIYLPGELGVRIEDLVVVGESGAEVLTPFPKELTVIG
jgi:Xaa-Pro aminopeptidase